MQEAAATGETPGGAIWPSRLPQAVAERSARPKARSGGGCMLPFAAGTSFFSYRPRASMRMVFPWGVGGKLYPLHPPRRGLYASFL